MIEIPMKYHISDPRHAAWGCVNSWVQILIGVAGLQGGMAALKHTASKREEAKDE